MSPLSAFVVLYSHEARILIALFNPGCTWATSTAAFFVSIMCCMHQHHFHLSVCLLVFTFHLVICCFQLMANARRTLQAQADILNGKTLEKLECLKLELAKKAAEDMRILATELAAAQDRMEKVGTQRSEVVLHG